MRKFNFDNLAELSWDGLLFDGPELLPVQNKAPANLPVFAPLPPGPLFATNLVLNGTDGDDIIEGGRGSDTIYGFDGNDTLSGGHDGYDTIYGGDGDDIITDNGYTNDRFYGGSGDDHIYANSGDDLVEGGAGNDYIDGGRGDDLLDGGVGDDIMIGDRQNSSGDDDTIIGGAGIDTVVFDPSYWDLFIISEVALDTYHVTYGLESSSGNFYNLNRAQLTGVEFIRLGGIDGTDYAVSSFGLADIILGDGNDSYVGSDFAETVYGLDGNDSFSVRGGDDIIDGGAGQDTVNLSFAALEDFEVVQIGTSGNSYSVVSSSSYQGAAQSNTLHNVELIRGGGVEAFSGDIATLARFYTMDTHLTTGSDIYIGSALADGISGRTGDDNIQGLGGDDIILGGQGHDIIDGGDGNDYISGSLDYNGYNNGVDIDDDDILYGGAGDDIIIGGDGNDFINGGSGNNSLDGGYGIDTISYEDASGGVTLNLRLERTGGAAAGDTIKDFEIIIGSDYDDHLIGDFYLDLIMGGGGDDIIDASRHTSTYNGGMESSVYLATSREDLTVTQLSEFSYTVEVAGATNEGTDTLIGVDGVRLGGMEGEFFALNYLATGLIEFTGYSDHVFSGYSADEIILGAYGDDIIDGGTGNNTLNGAGGDDILISLGNDILLGGWGDDVVEMGGNVFDASTVTDGEGGVDTISFSTLAELSSGNLFLVLDLESQSYSVRDGSTILYVDQFSNFENATGSGSRDLLQGNADINVLRGLGGNDILQGRGGDDFLEGGMGDDNLSGGAGIDTAVYSSANVSDYQIIETAPGEYTITALNGATDGTDTLTGIEFIQFGDVAFDITELLAGNRVIQLTNERDIFTGSNFDETIHGREGNDVITGGDGNNIIYGGDGSDTIAGGLGTNILNGGDSWDTFMSLGNDTLIGGEGRDIFDLSLNISGHTIIINGGESSSNGSEHLDRVSFETVAGIDDGMGGSSTFLTVDLMAQSFTLMGNSTVLSSGTLTDIEEVYGTEYRDVIRGDAGDNHLFGRGGNDILEGGAGDDRLYSGEGDNTLYGGEGVDRLYGGQGHNILYGGADRDYLYGNGDFSILYGGAGSDILSGGNGKDTLYGGADDDFLDGNSGDDILYGNEGNDRLDGGYYGNDILYGGDGDDTLIAYRGNDVLFGGAGADILEGGDDFDIADYSEASAAIIYDFMGVEAAQGEVALDTLSNIEGIRGTDFDDSLYGDDGASALYGGAGDDLLAGRDGDDVLAGDAGADTLDGGGGFDMADYTTATSYIVYDFMGLVAAQGEITNDTLISIEAIRGTAFNDRLFGDNDVSLFYGGEGADRLFGRNGDDSLFGEGGDDIILGGRDNDFIDGGDGNDQLRGNEGDDTIFGGDGNDAITGGAGADVIDGGAGIDRVEYTYGTNAGVTASLGNSAINTGDAAGDSYVNIENLYGTSFADTLYGDTGDNRIDGRGGDDALFGGTGNDYLIGGAGNDVLNGQRGNDLLLGQSGADIYQFNDDHGTDRIVIFTQGEDLIEFLEDVFDFSDLTITQDGAHVNIDTGEGLIIVNNSLVADFTTDDFIFAPVLQEPLQEPLDMTQQDMAMFVEVDALI